MRRVNRELAALQARFLAYYNENLGNKFSGLEKVRRKYLFFFWKWLFIFVALIAGLIYWCGVWPALGAYFDSKAGEYTVAAILVVMFLTLSHPFTAYKSETKKQTMDKILAFFGNFRYAEGRGTDEHVLCKSGLIGKYDRQYGDDFFTGTYNGVNMQVSEERLTIVVQTNKGSRESTVFKGIIIVLDMNKPFSGQTVVRDDWGFFNFLMFAPRCVIKNETVKLEKVCLEDSVFERKFEAFSNDQIEARYLLTTAFMDRILEVKKRFHGRKIEFSFFDNKLFIAVSTGKDMFETTSLFSTTARYGRMREVVSQFYSVFSIIDLLKLNKKTGL